MYKKTAQLSEKLNESQLAELSQIEKILEKHKHHFNLLNYFEDIFSEIVYTRIFAFFLDSEEKHSLGISFFNYWIEQLSLEQEKFKTLFLDKFNNKAAKTISRTEWSTPENRRLDLILELNDSAGNVIAVIGLENKVDASEQEEQLSDYQKALIKKFPSVPKIILFSTPDGREPTTALKKFKECPCLPISYTSFRNVFEYFSKNTTGEIQLIINSTFNYLDYLLARVRKKQIDSLLYDSSAPINERNKYSPVLTFFNIFIDYLIANKKFPFRNGGLRTFSTDEISISVFDIRTSQIEPAYVLKSLKKEPRVGDYFVVMVMLYYIPFRVMKAAEKKQS